LGSATITHTLVPVPNCEMRSLASYWIKTVMSARYRSNNSTPFPPTCLFGVWHGHAIFGVIKIVAIRHHQFKQFLPLSNVIDQRSRIMIYSTNLFQHFSMAEMLIKKMSPVEKGFGKQWPIVLTSQHKRTLVRVVLIAFYFCHAFICNSNNGGA
jgi:hypothetical protein